MLSPQFLNNQNKTLRWNAQADWTVSINIICIKQFSVSRDFIFTAPYSKFVTLLNVKKEEKKIVNQDREGFVGLSANLVADEDTI